MLRTGATTVSATRATLQYHRWLIISLPLHPMRLSHPTGALGLLQCQNRRLARAALPCCPALCLSANLLHEPTPIHHCSSSLFIFSPHPLLPSRLPLPSSPLRPHQLQEFLSSAWRRAMGAISQAHDRWLILQSASQQQQQLPRHQGPVPYPFSWTHRSPHDYTAVPQVGGGERAGSAHWE